MNRLPGWLRQHIAALRGLLIFTVICGIAYPVVMWGFAQVAFHDHANGSLVSYHGRIVGSSVLCQEFVDAKGNPLPQYFQPRPSAAADSTVKTDYGCDPLFSAASNLGPNNPVLIQNIKTRQRQIAAFDHVKISQIPADAVTASGSGLDPGISPANAAIQVNRVGTARQPCHGRDTGQPVHSGPHAGLPRRATSKRAQLEHRPGREVPGQRLGDESPAPGGTAPRRLPPGAVYGRMDPVRVHSARVWAVLSADCCRHTGIRTPSSWRGDDEPG